VTYTVVFDTVVGRVSVFVPDDFWRPSVVVFPTVFSIDVYTFINLPRNEVGTFISV
jgi:hypothetical protein